MTLKSVNRSQYMYLVQNSIQNVSPLQNFVCPCVVNKVKVPLTRQDTLIPVHLSILTSLASELTLSFHFLSLLSCFPNLPFPSQSLSRSCALKLQPFHSPSAHRVIYTSRTCTPNDTSFNKHDTKRTPGNFKTVH
ncbi:hypothetical protein CLIB1423_18S02454 [[Candida] railenensis]|uniref:Uncharacterized protein n=1 Tax=[Candida] railenensis TaxID=45579 RepID=A0A9P0QU01_9ASCO|nr:hypothetical protein CLIB1423_18S02454 [[Candida] railenensis]